MPGKMKIPSGKTVRILLSEHSVNSNAERIFGEVLVVLYFILENRPENRKDLLHLFT